MRRPFATQSGMPIDSKPLPATNSPGRVAQPRGQRRHARRVADQVLRAGVPAQRKTRASIGAAEMPRSGARSRTADVDQLAVVEIAARGIVHAAGEGAQQHVIRPGRDGSHFDDTQVHAVMRTLLCRRATTKPLPASGCETSRRLQPSATLAVETYGTVSQSRAALVVERAAAVSPPRARARPE